MRILVALVVGFIAGAVAMSYYNNSGTQHGVSAESSTQGVHTAVQDQLAKFNLSPQAVKEELARTGQVVRRKAEAVGQAIADATADARITTAIKARMLTSHDLPAMKISVSTTGGVVTLSGSVSSHEEITQAMLLAIEADGVREVISTLQIKPEKTDKAEQLK